MPDRMFGGQRGFGLCAALWAMTQFAACAPEMEEGAPSDFEDEEVATLAEGLSISALHDYVQGVAVQSKVCTTDSPASSHTVDCTVDAGYALVGGGARVPPPASGSGGLLRESRPVDGRTWRASSQQHIVSAPHNLSIYALGLRLDGVTAQTLRDQIGIVSPYAPANSLASPGIRRMISGGGRVTSGARFFTSSKPAGEVAVKDHIVSSSGAIELYLTHMPPGIIEGFGALEIQQRTGSSSANASIGVATATVSVTPGYAVIGYGGDSTSVSERRLPATG